MGFVQDLGPKRIDAWPLMLLRGTALEARKEELGLKEEILSHVDLAGELPKERIAEGVPHVVEAPSFSRDDWKKMNTLATELSIR